MNIFFKILLKLVTKTGMETQLKASWLMLKFYKLIHVQSDVRIIELFRAITFKKDKKT